MQVLTIQAQDTYPFRQQLLAHSRANYASLQLSDDNDEKSFHLGCFVEKKLVSVVSLYFHQHPDINAPYQYQMRGPITRPEYYRRGYAKALVQTAITTIIQNQGTTLWSYSPIESLPALLAMGLKPIGNISDISELGTSTPLQLLYTRIQ